MYFFFFQMPRIWIDYCTLMMRRGLITETRRVFDRAVRALPITQHMRIWPLYIDFITRHKIPETAIRVYRRFLKLWCELCDLISKNPNKIFTLRVEPIIRQGIARYTDQVGGLWLALAEYYIRTPNFEKARDIFEEALGAVKTVRDFTQLFDAYSKFMERMTSLRMDALGSARPAQAEERELELDLVMTRFEHLMNRRPLLLNSVLLRQNPHNVHEWLNRAQIYEGDAENQIATFEEAVATVDPKQQVGRLGQLWIEFAKLYEKFGKLPQARKVFEKAVQANFCRVDEVAQVWCEYAELELRHSNYPLAVAVLRRATTPPSTRRSSYFDDSAKVQNRVFRSLKLWSLYADIEESMGSLESCKTIYERMLELRIATPQIVINYALFLEDNQYYEDAFKAFEKGIGLFRWPLVFDIWNVYLTKFIQRYGGKKLERARDLFEQCLDKCPSKYAKNIYLLYAKLEEQHGLARHALDIYNRATGLVEKEEMHLIYNVYVKKAMQFYGITKTRPIFESAIERLPEDRSRDMSLRYAQMERNLGEIDRARAIYAHCAEICDPRVQHHFWESWKEFEVKHGNEDTIREMLRVKRSVQATYNTSFFLDREWVVVLPGAFQLVARPAQMLASLGGQTEMAGELSAADSMAQLEARATQIALEEAAIAAKKVLPATDGRISFVRGESRTTTEARAENPEEIDIDNIEEEEAEGVGQDDDGMDHQQQQHEGGIGINGGGRAEQIPQQQQDTATEA
uniref:Pre-mRNA-splicing factor SYF1 n=1 Tax=Globodera pallida TaxID=36090 RepID=A0A183CDC4_GLOPA